MLLALPLACSQTVQGIADNAAVSKTGLILLPSKAFNGRDDPANCNVQINISHASNGLVTVSGVDQSTTIDCSGTGLRCFSVTGVSVIIQNVKFIGNRAMFPQPDIPAAPSSYESAVPSSDEAFERAHSTARTVFDTELPNGIDRASFKSDNSMASHDDRHDPLSSSLFGMKAFLPRASGASPGAGAADPVVPLAGGCILIYKSDKVIIQDASFSNCASSAVGGSVAILSVTTVQVLRSTLTDSLVNVVNSSYLSQGLDKKILNEQLSKIPGVVKLPGGVGYGGSLFVVPTYSSGVSIVIKRCTFRRSQVLAVSKNMYDFSYDPLNAGSFLQGGAIAAFPPVVNQSASNSTGYNLAILESSFTQCVVLNSAVIVPFGEYDVVMGGAISFTDTYPHFSSNNSKDPTDASDVYPFRSHITLQDVSFSSEFCFS